LNSISKLGVPVTGFSFKQILTVILFVAWAKLAYFSGSCLAWQLAHSGAEGDCFGRFAMWDGWHYLFLSDYGYSGRTESCRFYPLFPLGIIGLARVIGGSHLLAGLLLSNLASLAGFVLFYYCVYSKYGSITAKWSLIFLAVFPGALFYQAVYSESLFFLLLMITWIGLERKLYTLVWAGAFLLPLTRANGVFIGMPIIWCLVRDKPLPFLKFSAPFAATLRRNLLDQTLPEVKWANLRYYRLLLAPLLGWGCYLGMMWLWAGDPWIGFKTQLQSHSVGNLVNIPKFVISFFEVTRWHAFESSFLERCIFVVFCSTLSVQWQLDRNLLVWTYILAILPAMSGELNSFTRYVAPAFPFFIALGAFLGDKSQLRKRWALLVVFILLHLILLWRYLNFKWAG
jgi:hypothetical protein